MRLLSWWLLATLFAITLATPSPRVSHFSMTSRGYVQLELDEPTQANHAATFGIPDGLILSLSNVKRIAGGSQADFTIEGSCPLGTEATFTSKTAVSCSFESGWAEVPLCLPVQCPVELGAIDATNCTESFYDYGTVCSATCTSDSSTHHFTCLETKRFDSSCTKEYIPLTCGDNGDSQIGNKQTAAVYHPNSYQPIEADGWFDDVVFAVQLIRTMCLVDSSYKIYCVGQNAYNEIDTTTNDPIGTPTLSMDFGAIGEVVSHFVSGAYHHTVVLKSGKAYTWGFNHFDQLLRDYSLNSEGTPTQVSLPAGRLAVNSYTAYYVSVFELDDGTFYGGGYNGNGGLGAAIDSMPAQIIDTTIPDTSSLVKQYSFGDKSLILTENGNVFARSTTASWAQQACLGSTSNTFVQTNPSLQGNVDTFTCNTDNMCVFLLFSGDIMMCANGDYIPGHTGASGVPINISSAVNANCDAGKKITKIKGGIHGVMYFFGECSATKVFGISSGLAPPMCRGSSAAKTVYEVMTTTKPVEDVLGSYSQTLVLTSK